MGIIEYLTSPQTLTSLAIALWWIWASYKVLEKRVENNEKDIKDMKKEIKDVKENQSTQMEDIKARMASIDIKVNEVSVNVAWVMDLLKKWNK